MLKKSSKKNNKEGNFKKRPHSSGDTNYKVNDKKKLKRPQWDEEINSDDEERAQEAGIAYEEQEKQKEKMKDHMMSDVEDDFFETAEDKRIRVAKQLLDRIGMSSKTDAEISERLTMEANISTRKVRYDIADKISIGTPCFYRGHKDSVTCLGAGAQDNTKIFTGSKDCSIICWDVPTGKKTIFQGRRKGFHCGGHFEQVLDVAVSEDSKTLLSVGKDRIIRLWDYRASTNKSVADLLGHSKDITGICSEPNNGLKRFFTISADKSLKLWSLDTQSCLDTFYGHTASPSCIDCLATDRPVTAGEDTTVRVWKISNESHLLYQGHTEPVDSIVQINGQRTISGSQDGSLCLWSVSSRKPLSIVPNAHNNHWITALGCVRYSDTLFSGSDDGYIRCWKISNNSAAQYRTLAPIKKKNVSLLEIENNAIPIAGVVNQLQTSADGQFLFAAIGREHRLGRWSNIKDARNGLLVVPLNNSLATSEPLMLTDVN